MAKGKHPEIELRHVTKEFTENRSKGVAISDISFQINEHEFVCVVGPSGCGKSTLLRIMAGLEFPSSGRAIFCGKPIAGPNPKHSAMIFQTFALLPWRNVSENIELGLQSVGMPKQKRVEIVNKYLRIMDLEDFATAYPFELSGGMKQRVGIARALAIEPRVLLMDEPFSSLDAMTADQLRNDVLEIWRNPKTKTNTFVMITHLIEEAVFLADRVIVLSKRPGRVIADIPIDIPRPRPEHVRSKIFFDMCDMLRRLISYHEQK
jgi:NitT/TauT family transport system ATP-binding protein